MCVAARLRISPPAVLPQRVRVSGVERPLSIQGQGLGPSYPLVPQLLPTEPRYVAQCLCARALTDTTKQSRTTGRAILRSSLSPWVRSASRALRVADEPPSATRMTPRSTRLALGSARSRLAASPTGAAEDQACRASSCCSPRCESHRQHVSSRATPRSMRDASRRGRWKCRNSAPWRA